MQANKHGAIGRCQVNECKQLNELRVDKKTEIVAAAAVVVVAVTVLLILSLAWRELTSR